MAKQPKQTKAQETAALVAAAVGAGRKLVLPSVDFADPNRPKTCLEVDFPILPINQIAQIEGNAGKPIYQMSKWWARRRSSVFRAMLIAAATKAPDEPLEAAKTVWDAYYANHQDNEAFRNLKVADIFMGGGTTLVEGARLGMQMFGNDLNPVAWFVVKNELAEVDLAEVERLFDHIEREVKSQIMPFYACEGPGGERGVWTRLDTGEVMGEDFDPLTLPPDERKAYSYEGPEVIYTFWAKHGPCAAPGCGHRTPLFSSPVIAIKTLTVKAWAGFECRSCHQTFDVERQDARMAPDVELVTAETEAPYAVMDDDGRFVCPHCGKEHQDEVAVQVGYSSLLPKGGWKNKKVDLSLLIHPEWMRGEGRHDETGQDLGGTATSDVAATQRWFEKRLATLRLIEVRGELPEQIVCPATDEVIDTAKGTIPRKSTFTCQAETCGKEQDLLASLTHHKGSGSVVPLLIQGFSARLDNKGAAYSGRYYKPSDNADLKRLIAAYREWNARKYSDFHSLWPETPLAEGFKTTYQRIPEHGFPRYVDMFNARQLFVLCSIAKAIMGASEFGYSSAAIRVVLGTFQQYLRNQNMFCFWNLQADKLEPLFSNNNYHPKYVSIENSVFSKLGRGNWASCVGTTMDGLQWRHNPWELASTIHLQSLLPKIARDFKGKSQKVHIGDIPKSHEKIFRSSSTDLSAISTESIDLVITDPPFGNNIQYAELADFFYVWLRPFLRDHDEFVTG